MRHYHFLAVLVRIQILAMWWCTIVRERIRILQRLTSRQMAVSTVIIHLNLDGDQITAVTTKINILNQSVLKIYCLTRFK